jgi:hypothetical protein
MFNIIIFEFQFKLQSIVWFAHRVCLPTTMHRPRAPRFTSMLTQSHYTICKLTCPGCRTNAVIYTQSTNGRSHISSLRQAQTHQPTPHHPRCVLAAATALNPAIQADTSEHAEGALTERSATLAASYRCYKYANVKAAAAAAAATTARNAALRRRYCRHRTFTN